MELSFCSTCSQCGAKFLNKNLFFVDGEYFCRNCLWERFYTKLGGMYYCVHNWEQFMEKYPDGLAQIRHILRNEQTTGDDHIEEYVSENLEDYCDFILDFSNNERLIRTVFAEIGRLTSEHIK